MNENYMSIRDLDILPISYKGLKAGDILFSTENVTSVANLFEVTEGISVKKGDKLIFDRVVCVYKKQNSSETLTDLLVYFENQPKSKFILKDSQVEIKEEK